jgi:hypothetical protein
METDITRLVHSLGSGEISVLLELYYNRDGVFKNFKKSDLKKRDFTEFNR